MPIADLNSLMVSSTATEHEIRVNEEDEETVMRVWVKELSFMQMQEAVKTFVNITAAGTVDIDLAAYWKFMFAEAIEKTEPRLTIPQMLSLKPFVATQITALLPQPTDLMASPLAGGLNE
jgi:hypothetical protein